MKSMRQRGALSHIAFYSAQRHILVYYIPEEAKMAKHWIK